jgi:serine/threonine-protein kinase
MIEPVLEALTAAHEAGIIHRDIKPENILLGHDGQVKVADFGLARPLNQATHAMTQGVVMGTVGYLAPEQVSDGSADTRSDIYAAGVMLYEMLTGQLPHSGSTPISVAYQSVHGDVPAPSAAVPGIPAALDTLVLRATARDPDQRPANGAAMLDELRHLAAYLPEPGHDPARPEGSSAGGYLDPPALPSPGATASYDLTGQEPPGLAPRYRHPHHRQRSWWSRGRLIAVAVATVITVLGGLVTIKILSGPHLVRVPPLVGLDQATAEQRLADAGLLVALDAAATSDAFTAGRVIEQHPATATAIKPGSTVRIRLSLGTATVRVPDVATLSVTEAQSRLTREHLTVASASRQEPNDTITAGNVIRTDPAAGTELAQGTQVTMIISTGPATVTVPDVIRHPSDQARNQLQASGLTVTSQIINDDTVPAGYVVRTSPDPGQQVNRGSTVIVFVSQGPADSGGDTTDGNPGRGGNGRDSGDLVTVPDVRHRRYQAASKELRDSGLKADRAGFISIGDTVTSMKPDPGSQVPRGSTVLLTTGID